MPDPLPSLDLELLRGFGFVCRPDCGLCCYAEPRIERPELSQLLQIAPSAEIVGTGADRFLAARPHGGACQFLRDSRCSVHSARPSPCREFPVSVHLGERLQATLVLSCPGLDLAPLTGGDPPAGEGAFASELASVRHRLGPSTLPRIEAARRRRRRLVRELDRSGLWTSEEEVRSELLGHPPRPGPEDFPVEDPPDESEGWEHLPLFFDGRSGPVSISRALGGWAFHEMAAAGGSARALGVVPPPSQPPAADAGAMRLLDRYLDYWLRRDAFFGSVLIDAREAGAPVVDVARLELRAIGAQVLARAQVRVKLRGRPAEVLSAEAVKDGIRAVDQDWLDRPTWGDRL